MQIIFATTPVKPEVIEEMMTIYKSHFGNPSSIHSIGRDARRYLDESRRTVAKLLNAKPSEVILQVAQLNQIILTIKGLVYANEHLEITLLQLKLSIILSYTCLNNWKKKDMMSLI